MNRHSLVSATCKDNAYHIAYPAHVVGLCLPANPIDRVFVNGRSRPVIMEDMQKRIDRADIQQEKKDAIKVRSCPLLDGYSIPSNSSSAPYWKHYFAFEPLTIPLRAGNV